MRFLHIIALAGMLIMPSALHPSANVSQPSFAPAPGGNCVIFFKNASFEGDQWALCDDSVSYPSLPEGWNDQISSIYIPSGKRITVYEHASYGGKCRRFRGSEQQANLADIGANDQISSVMINPSNARWLRCW